MSLDSLNDRYDAIIIGGGFYGCSIGLHLHKLQGFKKVLVVERGGQIMGRASYNNQARVHQGYHYPRDFTTAYRSAANFQRFVRRYKDCITDNFQKLYVIARRGSMVGARQFEEMMGQIGAPCKVASYQAKAMFSSHMVEEVFETQEYAFDSKKLAHIVKDELIGSGVNVLLNTEVKEVVKGDKVNIVVLERGSERREIGGTLVFNCTYGRIASVPGIPAPRNKLKYEVTEMCLVEVPEEIRHYGITVMDGPFWSCMPFPARGLHSLSHVRYTPHISWREGEISDREPYGFLEDYKKQSNFDYMLRDAALFMPSMAEARYIESLFEVKTVLLANEENDGRPILVEGSTSPGGMVSILGGKVDNIFDVLASLDEALRRNEY